MIYKLFTRVFFENKKILVAFLFFFIVLYFYIDYQFVVFTTENKQATNKPDIVLAGAIDVDGGYRYKMYNAISGDADEFITNKLVGDFEIYNVVVRNIATMQYQQKLYNISYQVIGLDSNFINQKFGNYISKGSMPRDGEKEVLMGQYAAEYFGVDVGDTIDFGVSLYEEMDDNENEFVVSGILDSSIGSYSTDIMICYDSYEKIYGPVDNNMMYIYWDNKNADENVEILNEIRSELNSKYNVESITSNEENKTSSYYGFVMNSIGGLLIAVVLLILMIMYLMKGLVRKIGTLKAMGISNSVINVSFIGGISILMIFSSAISYFITNIVFKYVNNKIAENVGYTMNTYLVEFDIYLKSTIIILFVIILLSVVLSIMCNKISPKDAMIKE